MVAAHVDARRRPHRALDRSEGGGRLGRLGVGDAVGAQEVPLVDRRAEPATELGPDGVLVDGDRRRSTAVDGREAAMSARPSGA